MQKIVNTQFLTMTNDVKKKFLDKNSWLSILINTTGHLDNLQALTRSDGIMAVICKLKKVGDHLKRNKSHIQSAINALSAYVYVFHMTLSYTVTTSSLQSQAIEKKLRDRLSVQKTPKRCSVQIE